MRLIVVGFVAGAWLLARSTTLPDACFVQMLPVCALWLGCRTRTALVAAVGCGFLWAAMHAHVRLAAQLPAQLEGRDLLVVGTVVGIPRRDERAIRFLLEVERVFEGGAAWRGVARLSWYRADASPRSGRRVMLRVVLAQPRGFVNPGGFDYEGWLFARVSGLPATCVASRPMLR